MLMDYCWQCGSFCNGCSSKEPNTKSKSKSLGDASSGRWITIGAQDVGFPVQLSLDGEIVAGGPHRLLGMNIETVSESLSAIVKSIQPESGCEISTDSRAKAWGIEKSDYKSIADFVWGNEELLMDARDDARKFASKKLSLTAEQIELFQSSSFQGDYEKSGELAAVGPEIANTFPDLGWDEDQALEYDRLVWDLVGEGKKHRPTHESAEYHGKVDEFIEQTICGFAKSFARVRESEDWKSMFKSSCPVETPRTSTYCWNCGLFTDSAAISQCCANG